MLLIAAVQASHARWFPSLPARNLGLARAQFRNATEGMTQQIKGLINDTCIQNQNGLLGRRKGRLGFCRETLLYGIIIFVLLACVRWVWHINFATNLLEIFLVSTIVFPPLVSVRKHLFIDAFKWPAKYWGFTGLATQSRLDPFRRPSLHSSET